MGTAFPIIDLLTMPLRMKMAGRGSSSARKLEAARSAFDVAVETRRAYFEAVAARGDGRATWSRCRETAEASAELARRMARAGNFPRLTQMREQVFYAETVAQLARARQAAVAERERLTRLMGLYGEDVGFVLPERLPDLPARPPSAATRRRRRSRSASTSSPPSATPRGSPSRSGSRRRRG